MDALPFGIAGCTLARASPEDMDFVMDAVARCVAASVPADEAAMGELWMPDILSISKASIESRGMSDEVFVLTRGGERAGMLWLGRSRDQFTCDETGYLLGIYVAEGLRGRGYGRELLRSAEAWCRGSGLLSLTANVGAANARAAELYASSGFEPRSAVLTKRLGPTASSR